MMYLEYHIHLEVNGHVISKVRIGRHYLEKHSSYMNDKLILDLVQTLHGHSFAADSATNGIDYFVADVEYGTPSKIYRLIWIIEGDELEILGVVNAYRRKKRRGLP